jgi:fucose 4-O-acetylase-like acetyltransferase
LYGLAGLSLGLLLNLDNFKNHFKFKNTNPFYWLNLFFLIFTFLVEGEILGYSLDFLSVFQVMSFYLLFSNIPVLEKNQTLEWLGKQSLLIYIIHIILIKLIQVLFF